MDVVNPAFIGIRPGPEVVTVIERQLLNLKRKPGILDMRWQSSAEYMINLFTLGEISPATLQALKPVIRETLTGVPSFSLTMSRFVGTPNLIQPRYAVLELTGQFIDPLAFLATKLEEATKPLTPPRDAKPFQPHVALGRIKTESEQLRVAMGRALKMPDQEVFGEWPIQQIELLISHASPTGVQYVCVENYPLIG